MVRRRVLALVTGLVVALGGPAGATAQVAPEDASPTADPAAEQYVESTPGDRTTRRLPERERRQLERGGPDAAALVTAVGGGAPPAVTQSAGPGSAPAGGSASPAAASPAPTAPRDAPDRVDQASVGPVALWIVLVALGVAGSAAALLRWRRAS